MFFKLYFGISEIAVFAHEDPVHFFFWKLHIFKISIYPFVSTNGNTDPTFQHGVNFYRGDLPVSSFQKPSRLNVKLYLLQNVTSSIRTLIQMPSSAQAMLYGDKSVESSCVTLLSVSFRYNCCMEPLRTYLQQSTPHSFMETSVTGCAYFQQISTCRATEIIKTPSISSCPDLILKESVGTIQPHRIVHDEKAYFCLLLARSTAVKKPGLSHRGRPSNRKRKKGDGGYSVEPVPLKDAAWAFVVFPSWPAMKDEECQKKHTSALFSAAHANIYIHSLNHGQMCLCTHRTKNRHHKTKSRE